MSDTSGSSSPIVITRKPNHAHGHTYTIRKIREDHSVKQPIEETTTTTNATAGRATIVVGNKRLKVKISEQQKHLRQASGYDADSERTPTSATKSDVMSDDELRTVVFPNSQHHHMPASNTLANEQHNVAVNVL